MRILKTALFVSSMAISLQVNAAFQVQCSLHDILSNNKTNNQWVYVDDGDSCNLPNPYTKTSSCFVSTGFDHPSSKGTFTTKIDENGPFIEVSINGFETKKIRGKIGESMGKVALFYEDKSTLILENGKNLSSNVEVSCVTFETK